MQTSKRLTYSSCNPEIHNYDLVFNLCRNAALAVNGTIDEDSLHQIVEHFVYTEDNSKAIMLLAFDGDKPIAVLCALRVFNHFLFGDSMCTEQVLWVEPEYRKTRAALKLLNAYELWAKNIGCTRICLSDIHQDEKLQRVYNKRGYQLFECAYIKDVE